MGANITQNNKPLPHATSPRRKILTISLALIFLLIGVIVLLYWFFIGEYYERTDDAYVRGNLVRLMPQISGTVTQIQTDDTHLVEQGQSIITLDNTDAVVALQGAIANLARTVREVKRLYESVGELQADVVTQKTNLEKAKTDYIRRRELISSRAVSTEELQHASDAVATAQAQLESTQHQLTAAIALVSNSDLYNHPIVLAAESQLRDAYLRWRRTVLLAPATGYIAQRQVQVGQQVNPGSSLLLIVPLNQIWVDANFKESELKNVRIGQKVELTSDLYGHSVVFRGQVVGLSPGTGSIFELLPPQNATGNWIKIVQRLPVRIVLDPEQLKKFPLRVGLSMTATVDTHDRNGPVLATVPLQKTLFDTIVYNNQLADADALIEKIVRSNVPENIVFRNNK